MFKPRAGLAAGALLVASAFSRIDGQVVARSTLLISRSDLNAAATQADIAAAKGSASSRSQYAVLASAIRQRLREGDFRVGDRIVVTITSDAVRRDTVLVRSDLSIELPGPISVPLAGVLRSEVKDRVATEVLKYVKAAEIEVTPLVRLAVLGAVGRPGYFTFTSDTPLSDVIMGAGGPTPSADFGRSVVRRGTEEFRSAADTRNAISGGLTVDQFGLSAGDEVFIGTHRGFNPNAIAALAGAFTSVFAVYLTIHH